MTKVLPRGLGSCMFLLVLLALTFYPFFFMVMTAFKDNGEFTFQFWWFALPLHWDYLTSAAVGMGHYILNSAVVAAATIAGVLATATLAAYAFARFSFWGRQFWYYSLII